MTIVPAVDPARLYPVSRSANHRHGPVAIPTHTLSSRFPPCLPACSDLAAGNVVRGGPAGPLTGADETVVPFVWIGNIAGRVGRVANTLLAYRVGTELVTARLQDALRETLANWQSDLSHDWQSAVDGVELAFDAVDDSLELHPWEPIFPSRRHFSLPGEPDGAHMFRAFDHLPPHAVRCVLVGQDPYPNIAFCTGRAFESGEHRSWRELDNMRSRSMRCLIQSLYAFRSGNASHAENVEGWPATLKAIDALGNGFPTPAEIAQTWVDQGVLLLNASLTLTRFAVEGDPHQTKGHLPLWRPLIGHVLRHFASRPHQPVVFMLFGDAAQDAAMMSGIANRDSLCSHSAIVTSRHPAEGNGFLKGSNPFVLCNNKLLAMDAEPIHW